MSSEASDRLWLEPFMAKLLSENSHFDCLVLSREVPAWALGHPGPISLICDRNAIGSAKSQRFECYIAPDYGSCVAYLDSMQARRKKSFDLVFIDHDHTLQSVLQQISALKPLISEKTILLFDDAVPPEWHMTGSRPKDGSWWVGEVWMLRHLLQCQPTGGYIKSVDVQATGLLIARAVDLPDQDTLEREYAKLAAIDELEGIKISRADMSGQDALTFIQEAMAGREAQRLLKINPASPKVSANSYTQLEIEEVWEKRAPSFVLDLSERNYELSFLSRSTKKRHGTSLCGFNNVDLIGFATLIDHNRAIMRYEEGGCVQRVASRFGTYANEETQLRLDDGKIVLSRDMSNPICVDEPVFLGTPDEPDNWGMWLFQGLRGVYEFLKRPDEYKFYMAAIRSGWQRELLKCFGLPDGALFEQNVKEHYRLSRCGVITQTYRDLVLSPADLIAFRALANQISANSDLTLPKRIFVSRLSYRKRGSYRNLLNEQELADKLSVLGFVVVEPENYSIQSQIAMFAAADVIVGLGGAGMFNAAFCKPETKLVSIESTSTFLGAHTNIFASLSLDYGIIIGKEDLSDQRPSQKDWTVDVDAAIGAIQSLL